MKKMWETEMVEILRVLINDTDKDNERFCDDRLKRIILVAALQVSNNLEFSQEFVVDISKQSITPDPSDTKGATRDDSFINLVCIKAACLIDRGQSVEWANKAIAGRDGFISFDLRGVSSAQLKLLEIGWCAVYEEESLNYQVGSSRVAGAAIMGPFRTIASYSNYYGYN